MLSTEIVFIVCQFNIIHVFVKSFFVQINIILFQIQLITVRMKHNNPEPQHRTFYAFQAPT
jgi:hypothetical protein